MHDLRDYKTLSAQQITTAIGRLNHNTAPKIMTHLALRARQPQPLGNGRSRAKALKLLRRVLTVSKVYDGEKFFTIENGRRVATPLLMVVVLIEFSDVIFAVDSIPAIYAVTTDAFIVLTSNIFAILGLRAMYFLLAAVANRFSLLSYGLACILVFIGIKMLLIDLYKIPATVSLGVVLAILTTTMALSWIKTQKD